MYALAVALTMLALFVLFGKKTWKIIRELYTEIEIEQ